MFPGGQVQLLNRSTSDHSPLLYKMGMSGTQPKMYRFQNFWVKRADFLEVVKANWNLPVVGYGMHASVFALISRSTFATSQSHS